MDLKDKLDLLWKYLLLAVVIFGIVMLAQRPTLRWAPCAYDYDGRHHAGIGHGDMDHAAQVKVEKKIIDSDTTVVVWVNGEMIDNPEEFLAKKMHDFKGEDHDFMKWKDAHGQAMKKKARIKVQEDDD